jgi:hypothetical protein
MENFNKVVEVSTHDKLYSNKFFQEGRKMAQDGDVPTQVHKGCWVKKMVSPADWASWFSKDSTYVKLSEEKKGQVVLGVWMGFLTGMPGGASGTCTDLNDNDDEKYLVYQAYKRNNIYPLPKLPVNYKPSVDARGYQFQEQIKAEEKSFNDKFGIDENKDIDPALIPF